MPSPTPMLVPTGHAAATRRYSPSNAFFNKAVRKAVRDSVFFPLTLGEKHDVSLKPGFKTACWAWLPPHRIYIGTGLFDKDALRENLSETDQSRYIENHYHHELGHAFFTERDMRKVKAGLKIIKCPFDLFNLFEDARMEEAYRKATEFRFEWLSLETAPTESRPDALLFGLIQAEGDLALLPSFEDPEEADRFNRVVDYYQRAIHAPNTMALMPILEDWLKEFPPPPQSGKGGGQGMEDLEVSAELMTNPDFLLEFESNTQPLEGDPSEPRGGAKHLAAGDESHQAVSARGAVLTQEVTHVDVNRASSLATRLSRVFVQSERLASTRSPQKKVSARNFALGRKPFRKKEITGRKSQDVFLVLDCSGSMRGFHIMEGKVLLTALSILAKRGHITGHVALSAVVGGPCWELFKLPVAQEVIDRIQGYAGSEGLEYTLKDNIRLAAEADYVFVYTDGQICDRPINKKELHRRSVETWGLYAGQELGYAENLQTYFDKALIRPDAEGLVDAIVMLGKS